GAGVVHSEMPEKAFTEAGGRMHGFQLWVNLPRKDKMAPPHYQDIKRASIPVSHTQDGKVTVRTIAGQSLGTNAVIQTKTPIMYLHILMEPGSQFVQPVPPEFNVFAYVIEGSGFLGKSRTKVEKNHQMATFAGDGKGVYLEADEKSPLEVL